MQLKRIETPNKIFYIDPEKFGIISPDNLINYVKLEQEVDDLINNYLHVLNEEEHSCLTTTLEFLISFSGPEAGLSEWISNLILETPKTYKSHLDTLDIIREINIKRLVEFKPPLFGEIIKILREYLSLKNYILSYRAYYFEHIAFSNDGYSLKRDMDVYFIFNSHLRVGKVYNHLKDKVTIRTRADKFIDLRFDKVYCEKNSLKKADK